MGRDLASLKRLGERVNASTRSMGVALTSCTVPAAGRPTFQLGEAEMEMGVGIHGEPGRRRVPMAPADRIAEEMVGAIASDLADFRGEALLLVNGFGGTPMMELYLMYNAARTQIEKRGARVVRSLVGQLRHVARYGRLLDHGLHARRRARDAVGRAGRDAKPEVGALTAGQLASRPLRRSRADYRGLTN